jgi:hypothetical protein
MASLVPSNFAPSEESHGLETFLEGITNVDSCVPAPELSRNSLAGSSYIFPLAPNSDSINTSNANVTLVTLEYWSQRYISHSCRQLIISLVRAFPRMIVKPESLPPFIHRVGCGLEYNDNEPCQMVVESGAPVFAPLRPLAGCVNIARIFVSRVPNSEDFLWQTIEAEQRRIRDAVSRYVHRLSWQ